LADSGMGARGLRGRDRTRNVRRPMLSLTPTRVRRHFGYASDVTRGDGVSARPAPRERLANPAAFLSRTDLRELGLERRAVDAVFRPLPVVVLPGYSRPLVKVADYLELVESSMYRDDRVRP